MNTNIELLDKLTKNWQYLKCNTWKISPSKYVCYHPNAKILEIHCRTWGTDGAGTYHNTYRPYAIFNIQDDIKFKIKIDNNLLIINDMVAVVYE